MMKTFFAALLVFSSKGMSDSKKQYTVVKHPKFNGRHACILREITPFDEVYWKINITRWMPKKAYMCTVGNDTCILFKDQLKE